MSEQQSATTGAPAGEPVLTQVMQVGIVVRDLEATIQKYVDDYGIGPWERVELDPATATDLRVHGQPAELWRVAAAVAMVGQVMWELIQPLDEDSVFARFLAERGEGVHHIAVTTPDFDAAVAVPARRGQDLVLSGTFNGIRIAYLPTDHDLGVLFEVFDGMPGSDRDSGAR